MTRHRMPDAYRAPLRKWGAIVDFLRKNGGYRSSRGRDYLLSWCVKADRVDLSFPNMVRVARAAGLQDQLELHSRKYLRERSRDYAERFAPNLFSWACEQAREGVLESDSHRSLWDGKLLDVEYRFVGRSGGHIAISRYCDSNLAGIEDLLYLPYESLRDLYRLAVMKDHDFRAEAVDAEIEHQAAWILFGATYGAGDAPPMRKTLWGLAYAAVARRFKAEGRARGDLRAWARPIRKGLDLDPGGSTVEWIILADVLEEIGLAKDANRVRTEIAREKISC